MLNAKNNAETTLSVSVNSSVTSIDVVDASVFPSAEFVITIENEILKVTNVVGNTLTVVRGQEGTVASSHLGGVAIEHRWTAGMHAELVAAIGTRVYTEKNYIADGESLSNSVDALDQAVFDKALKGSGTPTSVTSLLNGWSGTIKYRKSEGGIVTLILNISNSSPSSLQNILNLPVDVRPEVETVIPVVAPATGVVGNVYINLAGNIKTVSGSTLSSGVVYHGVISYGV